MVHHFADPKVGCVQARWGHLNRETSILTRVQALMLDGHHMVENRARFAAGHFFNFSGTGGIWRREAIGAAGGWQHDTLTEDLDLSYRAQLAGWKFVYREDHVTPAELPEEIRERIFELFFSTRKGGSGLGLAIAERVVRAHGGELTFESDLGKGSLFRVALPLAVAQPGTDASSDR